MFGRLSVLPQYLLPKRGLTQFHGRIARAQVGDDPADPLVRRKIRRRHERGRNPTLPATPRSTIFSPPAETGARPLAEADFISPVDGAISQFGAIDDHHSAGQGASLHYGLTGRGDAALAGRFRHGSFANVSLAAGLSPAAHVRGPLQHDLFPARCFRSTPTARGVPGLFARNERVVCVFDPKRTGPS